MIVQQQRMTSWMDGLLEADSSYYKNLAWDDDERVMARKLLVTAAGCVSSKQATSSAGFLTMLTNDISNRTVLSLNVIFNILVYLGTTIFADWFHLSSVIFRRETNSIQL